MKKHYLYLIFGVVSAVLILLGLLYNMDKHLYDIETSKIEKSHHRIEESLKKFSKREELFLQTIASYVARKYDSFKEDDSKKVIIQDYLYNTVKSNTSIMQLRFLDTKGMERLRVDRLDSKKVVIIEKSKLQDKSKRDYFHKFIRLKQNQIGYSSIELNKELGKIEVPWRPTLRIGISVYSGGEHIGVVIINFMMKEWMKELESITQNNLYLVDSQGYFIIHPKKEWAWSKYQNPSKTIWEYFTFLPHTSMESVSNEYYNNHNIFIRKINFFNDEKLFFIYEPKVPIHDVLFKKSIQVGFFILLSLLLILLPVVKLIKMMFRTIKQEKDKLHKSTENLTKIFDNTFDAMFVISKNGSIKKVNKAAQSLFSYSEDELIGSNINILIPEPHHSKHDSYLQNYKTRDSSTVINIDRELEAKDKYDNLIPISLSVTKIELDNEMFFIGSIKDFTELQKSQEQQRKQETMLLEQSKLAAMGEMINAIAHQWRQPLNSIGLIVQDLASAQKHNELNVEYMKKSKDDIMNQLNHLSSTIDSFRNFFSESKTSSSFNLIKSVEELNDLYWAQFNAHDIKFDILCLSNENSFIPCDDIVNKDLYEINNNPNELKQVLLNLVSNSKDAIVAIQSPNRFQKKIDISLSVKENSFVIDIYDNAGGIPKDILNRIFEPYFTTKEMGTGLGLFIVKSIVEQHLQGSINYIRTQKEFEGIVYGGSKFSIELPKSKID